MATKKQMQELQDVIDALEHELEATNNMARFLVQKARHELLEIHNAINPIVTNIDECDGDFFFSDLQRLRSARDKIRESASIEPKKDDEGNAMWYCHQWVLKEKEEA